MVIRGHGFKTLPAKKSASQAASWTNIPNNKNHDEGADIEVLNLCYAGASEAWSSR